MHIKQILSTKTHFGLLNCWKFTILNETPTFEVEWEVGFDSVSFMWQRAPARAATGALLLCDWWIIQFLFPGTKIHHLPRAKPGITREEQELGGWMCVCLHMGWAGGKSAGLNWAVTRSRDVDCKSALFFLLWPYKCAYWNYLLERHTSLYAHMNLASYGM